jgi:very-short-patch-repair endonuclease
VLLVSAMCPPKNGVSNILSKKAFRRQLRNSLTPAEALLWKSLQRRQLMGKKFRRQYGVGSYIVDFYCPECQLAIELDGERHFSITIDDYEHARTGFLEERGLRVIRFENNEVLEDIEAVVDTIRQNLTPK